MPQTIENHAFLAKRFHAPKLVTDIADQFLSEFFQN